MSEARLRLRAAALSDAGRVRTVNEDSFVQRPDMGLWVVADGMGGHVHGGWASGVIAKAIDSLVSSDDFDADVNGVAAAIHAANATIHDRSRSEGASMGSTAAALLVQQGRFSALWAGDSRIYLLRDGALYQLTRDHTQVQELVDAGRLSQEEAKGHPMSHVLARAVGVRPGLELEAMVDEAAVGDVFLLCSDGLTVVVSDAEISEAMQSPQPQAICGHLVELCLSRGAPDNVTVVAVACEEVTLAPVAPAAS